MPLDRTIDALSEQLPALFTCEPHAEGVTFVTTPLMMPDGSMVTVFIDETGDCPRVTDYGDTLAMLRMMAPRCEELKHIPRLAEEAARVPGVALEKSELAASVSDHRNLAEAVIAVAQASLRVSCLAYACRDPEERSLYRELGDVLGDAGIRAERSASRTGASGRQWPVSYVVEDRGSIALIVAVNGGMPAQSGAVAEHMALMFEDLRDGATAAPTLVVVFNDIEAEWPDDAVRRLAEFAEAVPWSRVADLPRMLAREAAAVG